MRESVVEGHVGRRAHDHDDPRVVDAVGREIAGFCDKAGQGDLLLEAVVLPYLATVGALKPEQTVGICRRDRHEIGDPESEMIRRLMFVVHGRHDRDPERSRGDALSVRVVADGDAGAGVAGESPQRPPPRRQRGCLAAQTRAAMLADGDGLDAVELAHAQGLSEIARGHRDGHLTPPQLLDDRPEEHDVRRVGQIDPHRALVGVVERTTPAHRSPPVGVSPRATAARAAAIGADDQRANTRASVQCACA